MFRSLKCVLFSLCVARVCSPGAADNYGQQPQAKYDPGTKSSEQEFLRKPATEFQDLQSYRDWNLPTKDKFPLPDDAQGTPQKNDFVADLGTGYDKVLEDKLTKGKNFNPLAPSGV